MNRPNRRRPGGGRFRPVAERCEGRLLLAAGAGALGAGAAGRPPLELLRLGLSYPIARPNTPVVPFGATADVATFVDPSAHVLNGQHALIGTQSFVAPYATIDATVGFVKVGHGSAVLDNAQLVATPGHRAPTSSIFAGDFVEVGFGATVQGPSTIGTYGSKALPTAIGPNALIDGATIAPGAIVGALARVGPGVTVPSEMAVLPGANVTTQAEATNPALGKVAPVTAAQVKELNTRLAHDAALAKGYTTLYQGNSATGASPGTTNKGVFNGDLSAVEGASSEPGPGNGVSFEPGTIAPRFPSPHRGLVQANLYGFRARVVGGAQFGSRAGLVAHHLGRSNAVRADDGQPINFGSAPVTGTGVTINAPNGSVSFLPSGSGSSGSGAGSSSGTGTGSGASTSTGPVIPSGPDALLFPGAEAGTLVPTIGAGTGSGTSASAPTLNSPKAGDLLIGRDLQAGDHAVILGGPDFMSHVGDRVDVGAGAVVSRSTLGDGVVIGPRAYVADTVLRPGTVVPPGAILVGGRLLGFVQW